ncbi:Eco57I restriction-modification methylase domain-containing protein [Kaistella polysaccharea]|uniref:Eco57I restriction-modification methylase domain-containing protein n=1 Tax=Kaistella polysaccharea TaxID=2878534 RepID=UPI0028805DAE|nr:DNA methyltransferase [Kaistella polysaccharea]
MVFQKDLKDESVSQEDIITKKLYKDYSLFKRELFQNLTEINPEYEALELFKKSQKLLDRFLFLLFAEDRFLLPPNSVKLILNDWDDLQDRDEEIPLYNRFKKYFNYLNTGFKGKRYDVFAYNGGLFKPDEILDNIKIDCQLLYKHTSKLAEYDFASEVDVNILGHIFENSLNDLDEIKAQLEGQEIDKSKTKRKKDGVYYTPKYITKYIVDNTVGKLCNEKKAEFGIIEDDYFTDKKRQQKTKQNLLDKLNNYRNWLLEITVLDPACGSGAFLNEALNFLILEHNYVNELETKIAGGSIVYSYDEVSILENNIYGVDLNEESVEIAKLSLWLRTAKKDRKLNDLNDKIKCGNSLIDDAKIAGEKAFDWEQEFPQIFEKGGFDVVVGNPPYVKLESIKDVSEQLAKLNYQTFAKRGDLYVLFVEKAFNIVKDKGFVSFIMPNKWLQAEYGEPLRVFFLKQRLTTLIDFGDLQIFQGATTYPCIFIAEKNTPTQEISVSVLSRNEGDFYKNIESNKQHFSHGSFTESTWVISSKKDKALLVKIQKENVSLKERIKGDAFRGVLTGYSEAFFIDIEKRNQIVNQNEKSKEILFPFLQGRDIDRYNYPTNSNYLIGTFPSFKIDIENYPAIKNHLLSFGYERLNQSGEKGGRKKTSNKWFETQDAINYWKEFKKPKIMYQKFMVKPCFVFDEDGFYCNDSMWIIPTEDKGLLTILNSKMGWWLISKFCTQIQNGYQLIWNYFGQIPVPNTTKELGEKANIMLSLNKDLGEISQKFQRTLQRKFDLEKLSKKLEKWFELSFQEFIKELQKTK